MEYQVGAIKRGYSLGIGVKMLVSEQRNEIPWPDSAYILNRKRWKQFMSHDFEDPSRQMTYAALEHRIIGDFCEIGFGQCYDFEHCFKNWHDSGRIQYTGIDIVPEYVDFAKMTYPSYDFQVGGFSDLDYGSFDMVFVRHVFEHLSKGVFRTCFKRFLKISRKYANVSWAQRPIIGGNYRFIEEENVHFNAHDVGVVKELMDEEGYTLTEIVEFPHPDNVRCLWIMERR